jgi:hypothetical protein
VQGDQVDWVGSAARLTWQPARCVFFWQGWCLPQGSLAGKQHCSAGKEPARRACCRLCAAASSPPSCHPATLFAKSADTPPCASHNWRVLQPTSMH